VALINESCHDTYAHVEFFHVDFDTYYKRQVVDAPQVQNIDNAI
jgi:hypothetical protein